MGLLQKGVCALEMLMWQGLGILLSRRKDGGRVHAPSAKAIEHIYVRLMVTVMHNAAGQQLREAQG